MRDQQKIATSAAESEAECRLHACVAANERAATAFQQRICALEHQVKVSCLHGCERAQLRTTSEQNC